MSNPKNTRKCIVCKQHADKSELIRFVKNAEGKVVLDRSQKADGRGVWVHNCEDCIQKLIKKKTLNAATSATRSTERYMSKISAYVGLAQRSGSVLYGEDIICEKKNLVKVVLVSSSATDKYKERILKKMGDCPVFIVDGLCEALHREGVNAIAITNDNLAKAVVGVLR